MWALLFATLVCRFARCGKLTQQRINDGARAQQLCKGSEAQARREIADRGMF